MPSSSSIPQPGIALLPVQKITEHDLTETSDPVAVEEPLEINLEYGPTTSRRRQSISITMRTPGQDADLAIGFLFTEGILPEDPGAIRSITPGTTPNPPAPATTQSPTCSNTILISLHESITPDIHRLQRHSYTTSSCGVCGKTSIDAIRTSPPKTTTNPEPIDARILHHLPTLLRQQQDVFDATGGLHAAALFTREGRLLAIREDIGRHNAVDKLIGHALQTRQLPLTDAILLLSGRACFELIQKAAMAGIGIAAAVGPPSSLAVQLAEETGITLVGFLRQQRFNIYSGSHRIRI